MSLETAPLGTLSHHLRSLATQTCTLLEKLGVDTLLVTVPAEPSLAAILTEVSATWMNVTEGAWGPPDQLLYSLTPPSDLSCH